MEQPKQTFKIKNTENMKASEKAIKLIKQYEALRLKAYICLGGKLTIGWGHVIKDSGFDTSKSITPDEAEVLFQKDLNNTVNELNNLKIKNLSQGQFDALVVFVFNIGITAFAKSLAYQHILKGDYDKAAEEMFSKEKGFCKANGKFLSGLYARRQEELKLWNEK